MPLLRSLFRAHLFTPEISDNWQRGLHLNDLPQSDNGSPKTCHTSLPGRSGSVCFLI